MRKGGEGRDPDARRRWRSDRFLGSPLPQSNKCPSPWKAETRISFGASPGARASAALSGGSLVRRWGAALPLSPTGPCVCASLASPFFAHAPPGVPYRDVRLSRRRSQAGAQRCQRWPTCVGGADRSAVWAPDVDARALCAVILCCRRTPDCMGWLDEAHSNAVRG